MLVATVITSFTLPRQRNLVEIFPESLRILWSMWEIRVTVLVSLVLQGILILLGIRRKHSTSNWLRFILWLAYLSADWIATLSLSLLSSNSTGPDADSKGLDSILTAFWAPFLLLHLGGPDTITASSLEDNELWWRHFLALLVQVGIAVYIIVRAWGGYALNFLAIPVLIAGIIKLFERIMVLRSASSDNFRESMLPTPDPGPNYARYMNEFRSKESEGFKVELGRVIETPKVGYYFHAASESIIPDAANLQDAHIFFNVFKALFADLILSIHDIANSRSFFQREESGDKPFKVIEIELGFLYDVFYTKAFLVYSVKGVISRAVSSVCIITVSVYFWTIEKNAYVLLAGAIILEIYAAFLLIRSDWTMLWLSKKRRAGKLFYPAIKFISSAEDKRWSNAMSQQNLIRFCLEDTPMKFTILAKVQIFKKLKIYKMLKKNIYLGEKDINPELKKLIFDQLIKKSKTDPELEDSKKLCSHRGAMILESEHCYDKLGWSIEEEFDQSLLLWHIATDLCFYSDMKRIRNFVEDQSCKDSKSISEYLLYLLVMYPSMLPNGIGQIRFQDTCAEAIEFFKESKCKGDRKACKALLEVSTEIPPAEIKGDRSKSVLFDACRLAKTLQLLETEEEWDNKRKWKLISHVWVEMLSYAACHCPWNQHARQLRRGGRAADSCVASHGTSWYN